MATRLFCPLMVLIGSVEPPCAADAEPTAAFRVTEEKNRVTVVHTREPRWKMVFDREYGGVVREFYLPIDGPNLVATSAKAGGGVNSFRGMFSLFYMTRINNDPKDDNAIKAKGTLWGRSNGSAVLRIVSQSPEEVVVETKGTGYGWRLIGPPNEAIVEYKQSYTIRPDRVRVGGAFAWVYPYKTELAHMCIQTFFAPDAVNYPVRAVYAGGTEVALPVTSSGGSAFPGETYPRSLVVDLTTGYRLELRPRALPAVVEKSRWNYYERPWQQDWAQSVGFMGTVALAKEKFPAGKPVEYEYELGLSRPKAEDLPPRLTIISPKRDAKYKLGAEVKFTARATDGRGRALSDGSIAWEVFHKITASQATHAGAAFTYTLPKVPDDFLRHDYVVGVATVKDAAGRTSQAYVTIDVDVEKPKK